MHAQLPIRLQACQSRFRRTRNCSVVGDCLLFPLKRGIPKRCIKNSSLFKCKIVKQLKFVFKLVYGVLFKYKFALSSEVKDVYLEI